MELFILYQIQVELKSFTQICSRFITFIIFKFFFKFFLIAQISRPTIQVQFPFSTFNSDRVAGLGL